MPITSVKSVNLILRRSNSAPVAQFIVCQATIGAVLVAPLPLVVQLYSCYLLFDWLLNRGLIAPELRGSIRYFPHGEVELAEGKRIEIREVVTLYAALFLVIKVGPRHFLLWRDSCNEQQYRMLIFDQKRRRYASVE